MQCRRYRQRDVNRDAKDAASRGDGTTAGRQGKGWRLDGRGGYGTGGVMEERHGLVSNRKGGKATGRCRR